MNHSSLTLLVFAAIGLIRLAALGSKVRAQGDSLVFCAALPYRVIILLGSAGALGVLSALWHESQLWENVALLCISFGIALGWPSRILLTPAAVVQSIWWKPDIFIPWKDISLIERNNVGELLVYGANQSPIHFDRFHVDPSQFAAEVSARTGIKITDTSAPTHVTSR